MSGQCFGLVSIQACMNEKSMPSSEQAIENNTGAFAPSWSCVCAQRQYGQRTSTTALASVLAQAPRRSGLFCAIGFAETELNWQLSEASSTGWAYQAQPSASIASRTIVFELPASTQCVGQPGCLLRTLSCGVRGTQQAQIALSAVICCIQQRCALHQAQCVHQKRCCNIVRHVPLSC